MVNVERDILRNLTAKQLRGWEHYFELEVDDEIRADYRSASIVQMLYNINRGKNQKPLTIEECLVKFSDPDEPKKRQTPEQQFAMLKLLAAMYAHEPNSPAALPQEPEGPRGVEEQAAVEQKAREQLAMIQAATAVARKVVH